MQGRTANSNVFTESQRVMGSFCEEFTCTLCQKHELEARLRNAITARTVRTAASHSAHNKCLHECSHHEHTIITSAWYRNRFFKKSYIINVFYKLQCDFHQPWQQCNSLQLSIWSAEWTSFHSSKHATFHRPRCHHSSGHPQFSAAGMRGFRCCSSWSTFFARYFPRCFFF